MLNPEEYEFFQNLKGQTLEELSAENPNTKEFIFYLYLRDMADRDGNGFLDESLFDLGPAVMSGPLFIVVPMECCISDANIALQTQILRKRA